MKPYKIVCLSAVILLFICLCGHSIFASPFSNQSHINVIPQPRQVITSAKSPACVLDNEWSILLESTADETTRLAAELITKDLNEIWGLKVSLLVNDKALASTGKSIILGIPKRDKKIDAIATKKAIALNPDLHPQGYKISITPDWQGPSKILLLANSSQGLFYATQTFRQLITKDTANQIILPPVVIDDWPLFDYRGVQININERIKIDYLKNLIHLLSYYKMNILALQTSSLTEEQITELTKEASAYQINLVGDISMIKPGSSHHICPDKERCGHLNSPEGTRDGKGRISSYAKRPLGWADAVLKEQRFLSKIPKTTIVMNPLLRDREQSPSGRCGTNPLEPDNNLTVSNYYEQIESFRKEGLEQILCPRISVNDDVLPDILAVHKNIYTASQAGLRHLDNNHNILGIMLCSTLDKTTTFPEALIEPIAFTAECGWLPDHAPARMAWSGGDADRFSSNLTHSLFSINGNEAAEIINLLSSCNQLIKVDNLSGYAFTDTFKSEIHLDTPHFYGSLKRIKSLSDEALKRISSLQEKSLRSKEILDTWRYFASQWQAFAERFLTAKKIGDTYRYTFYGWKHAMSISDRQSIEKSCKELFDKASKEMDSLKEEYTELLSRRYAITETATTKSFEAAKTIWQEKGKNVSEAILSGSFPTPNEVGVSLAQLPERLVTPALKPPSTEMDKTFTWWDKRIHYRVLVTIENTVARPALGQEAFAYPVEIELNFSELLQESSITPTSFAELEFDPQSVRVIEYSKEGTPIAEVPYQMDKTIYFFDTKFNPRVILCWIIRKPIEAKNTKYFYVYFDTAKNQAPKYSVKYPYRGLSVSGTDGKGYWLKNDRFKVGVSSPSENNTPNFSLINSWVVRNFSTGFFTHLNLIDAKTVGFGSIQDAVPAGDLLLQNQADGPLLAKFHAFSKDGDGYLFNFYENLPICEVFTDSRINEFNNSYLIPQSYLAAALKDKMSAFSGAEYISSNYTRGKIPADKPIDNLQSNDSYWLAQRIVKGLTIASITPENGVTHYLKATPEDSNISISFGVAGTKPLHHFILYADTAEPNTFDILNQIKNVFTLENLPVIQRSRAEKLSP